MKLLITFNYFEAEFLLKKAKILEETIIFKDKKQKSKLYLLELFEEKFYFALLGMTQVLAMPTLQKILDSNSDIDNTLMFGSAGSYDYNVGKLVIINDLKYNNDTESSSAHSVLNKYYAMSVKIPKWIKKINGLPKLEIFEAISVNDIMAPQPPKGGETETPPLGGWGAKTCFDMESSEIAYLLKINKIQGVFFRIITDFGEIDFNEIKKVYASQTENLLKYIEIFIKTL